VADLTRATDAELLALFSSDSKPKCARFDPQQLERVLGDTPTSRHQALPIAAFTSLLAVAAGQEAVAQTDLHVKGEPAIERPAPPRNPVLGKMRIDQPQPVDTLPCTIKMGEVVPHSIPPTARPVIGDTVVMERPELPMTGQMTVRQVPTYCYIDGVKVEAGEGEGPPVSAIEEVPVITGGIPGTLGDVDGELTFRSAEPTCTDTVDVRALPLSGRVMDAATGAVLRGVTVEWVGTGLHCCTDVNGLFGFPVKDGAKGTITLRITAKGHAAQDRTLPLDKLPYCVPIAMAQSTEAATEVDSAPIDLGDLKLEQQDTMILGMVVAYKPSLWERVTRTFRRW